MQDRDERTSPQSSRWDQEGVEFVRTDTEWCSRFAERFVCLLPHFDHDSAMSLAFEACAHESTRALRPELAAEDCGGVGVSL
jgi:hypothetical protein